MRKGKSFSAIVKEKEKMLGYIVSYWKYIFSFCILQFFDMFFIEDGIEWTPFLTIEFIVFFVIGFALQGIHAYYWVQCKFQNREVLYDKILKEYYVDDFLQEYSNFGIVWKNIMTLTAHPEMNASGNNGHVFWGWGDDGTLTISRRDSKADSFKNGFSLKMRPWTCTEQKNIELDVVEPKLEERQSKEEFLEKFACCMKQDKIDYANQLYMYSLFLDERGNVVRMRFPHQPEKVRGVHSTLVTEEMLDEESNINDTFFKKSMQNLQALSGRTGDETWNVSRYGIVSIFQEIARWDKEVPRIGMLAFVQLENRIIEQLEQAGVKLSYVSKAEEIVELLFDGDMDEVEQYSLLLYAYAKKNRYDFVEEFVSEFRKIEKSVRAKRYVKLTQKQEQIYTGYAKEKLGEKIELGIRRFLYKLSKFVSSSIWTKILFLIIFALENVIEPFAAGSVSAKLTFETIGNTLIHENAKTFLFLMVIGFVWAVLLVVFNCKAVKKWMNPGIDMISALTTSKNEQYVTIGENTNLFWADDLIEGWSGDKITISVVRDHYQLTNELRQFENERIRKETNDGTKFRMIQLTEDKENEKIRILVDRCKYTETMRVQEMLKRYRTNKEGEDYYHLLRDGMINLKERSAAIRLENIPPNSLCMHAFVMTKDDYVLLTTRGENLAYYPGAYDCSAEEQLHMDDFEQDGVRIQNWVERFLEEELGLTVENCGSSSIGQIHLMSVFIEENALNTALAVKIRLNTSKKELEAILDNWPRKDYEFKYQLVNWETLVQLFEHVQRGEIKKEVHPTAINRLYLAACSEMRFDRARRFYDAYQKHDSKM